MMSAIQILFIVTAIIGLFGKLGEKNSTGKICFTCICSISLLVLMASIVLT